MSEAGLGLADSLTKCRLESIFGSGDYFGCLTISNLLLVVGIAAAFMLLLGVIILKNCRITTER